jgi:lysophospholipase
METAPLFELDQFSCPNGEAFYFPLDATNKLRIAFWNLESTKGTIVLQSGRTEFIEKYYEVISEFVERGYAVAMMDWRGQGLSSRKSRNKKIGHIDNFKTYDKDLVKVINECFIEKCPKPFIGFGHSMGGCLLTSYFISDDNIFDKCILCAPMVSVRANSFSRKLVAAIGLLEIFGLGEFAMQKPSWDEKEGWLREPFLENALTSDEVRFNRTYQLLKNNPELGVKGITVGWLKHALRRTNEFKSTDWSKTITRPLLHLNATEDKLVNNSLNKELLSQSELVNIKDIKSQHEIMMESDDIRLIAWEAIDDFLNS